MPKKIIHLMHNSQFAQSYITFMNQNFNHDEHLFIVLIGSNIVDIEDFYAENDNVIRIKFVGKHIKNQLVKAVVYSFQLPFLLLRVMPRLFLAKKIILHSLFIPFLKIMFLSCFFLLKKSYWFIWGGDLYSYYTPKVSLKDKIKEKLKTIMIKNFGAVIAHVKGDYIYAKEWYGFHGKYYSSFMYATHLYRDFGLKNVENDGFLNIQIGNSATATNYHLEVFEKLQDVDLTNAKVLVPLTYGDMTYKDSIIAEGKKIFEDKFIPMTEFLTEDEYHKFQMTIDIAIFNHNRQQGLANIIPLLGTGKKVYLNSDVTTFQAFTELGLTLFDIKEGISLEPIDPDSAKKNIEIIKDYFSAKQLKSDLEKIWYD